MIDRPSAREAGAWRVGILLASVLVGVAAGLAAMPTIFRATPTDISRTGVVLDALRDAADSPEIVVFGNSSIMSGIDAGQLREALDGRPLAWNLATTGQTLLESALLTEELPPEVDVAVYSLQLRALGAKRPLHPNKANAFRLYGFRPRPELVAQIGEIYGDAEARRLSRSLLAEAFDGRWAVRQLVDTRLRVLLRPDLSLASAEVDLLHPQRYTRPVDPAVLERLIAGHRRALEAAAPGVPVGDQKLLRELAAHAALAKRRVFVLLAPVHPAVRAGGERAFLRAASELAESLSDLSDVRVVDASALLPAAEFIDDLHPTDAGARRLTERLARAMAGAG